MGNTEECIESVTEGPYPLRIDAGVLSYEIFTPIVLGLRKILPYPQDACESVEVPG